MVVTEEDLIRAGLIYRKPEKQICGRKALANGRCPNHGGRSTGPRTAEGRKRISDAQKRRWAKRRSELA